jgi:hypothetical protein
VYLCETGESEYVGGSETFCQFVTNAMTHENRVVAFLQADLLKFQPSRAIPDKHHFRPGRDLRVGVKQEMEVLFP